MTPRCFIHTAEKRLRDYIKKHKAKWDAVSDMDKATWSHTLRERYIKEGMSLETTSFTQWFRHVEEIR